MPEPQRVPVAYKAVAFGAALLVLGLLFQQLVTLLLAVLITIVLAIALAAGATPLERRGIPRPIGALLVLLAGFAVLAGILALIIPTFVHETNQLVNDMPSIVDSLEKKIGSIADSRPTEVGARVQHFVRSYTNRPQRLIGPIASVGLSVAGVAVALVLFVITAYYMAARPQPLIAGALRLFPPSRRDHAFFVMERLRGAWLGWMRGVMIHMLLSGVLLYISLSIIGLKFAIVFAVATALLVVIPYLGVIVGAVPPVLFALTDSPETALLVFAVYVGVHEVEANLIIPIVMARTAKLHPALVAVGVVVVGELFGFAGLVVAIPIISAVVILVDEFWVKSIEAARLSNLASDVEVSLVPELIVEGEPGRKSP
jgi:predicted PurR-regulated permease PerM